MSKGILPPRASDTAYPHPHGERSPTIVRFRGAPSASLDLTNSLAIAGFMRNGKSANNNPNGKRGRKGQRKLRSMHPDLAITPVTCGLTMGATPSPIWSQPAVVEDSMLSGSSSNSNSSSNSGSSPQSSTTLMDDNAQARTLPSPYFLRLTNLRTMMPRVL